MNRLRLLILRWLDVPTYTAMEIAIAKQAMVRIREEQQLLEVLAQVVDQANTSTAVVDGIVRLLKGVKTP